MDTKKYAIERRYITKRQNTRPGLRLTTGSPVFFVAHDTGNPGAGADSHFRYFNDLKDRKASAQVFIDDKKILEIIPTGTGPDAAEKAWHVLYNVTTDNERFGYNANDAALGIELCYGGSINFAEAYKRFVWYLAYCCDKWGKDPAIFIPSHKQLDPSRKIDCDNALKTGGKTLKDLIADVKAEIAANAPKPAPTPAPAPAPSPSFQKLSLAIAQDIISAFVRPAWAAAKAAGQTPEAEHFHRLAVNLRSAAGVDDDLRALAAPVQLHKSNAQEIIFRHLSPGWYDARDKKDMDRMKKMNDQANALRRAAGMPIE